MKKVFYTEWAYVFGVLAVVISFAAFGTLSGVGIGTIICALVNGVVIAAFSKLLDKKFDFKTRFPKLEKIMQ